ncbi:MAG: hypothetical protein AAFV53_06870 [Myxococcota bacterium]
MSTNKQTAEKPAGETSAAEEKTSQGDAPDALAVAGGALADALGQVMRVVVRRGRAELSRAAAQGRVRMELRQLRKDRQRMFEKLGREVVRLVEGGELSHPGLLRGAERIQQLDAQIAAVEADVRATVKKGLAGEGEIE